MGSIRLWRYYWHLVIILSLLIFALWMQNPLAATANETIPLSFTQPYNPAGMPLVSRPYLLMIGNSRTEKITEP